MYTAVAKHVDEIRVADMAAAAKAVNSAVSAAAANSSSSKSAAAQNVQLQAQVHQLQQQLQSAGSSGNNQQQVQILQQLVSTLQQQVNQQQQPPQVQVVTQTASAAAAASSSPVAHAIANTATPFSQLDNALIGNGLLPTRVLWYEPLTWGVQGGGVPFAALLDEIRRRTLDAGCAVLRDGDRRKLLQEQFTAFVGVFRMFVVAYETDTTAVSNPNDPALVALRHHLALLQAYASPQNLARGTAAVTLDTDNPVAKALEASARRGARGGRGGGFRGGRGGSFRGRSGGTGNGFGGRGST